IDPSVNHVVFQLRTDAGPAERAADAPARADDCVRQAWAAVAGRDGARPEDVRQVYSEWEPSDADKAFLDATFPPDTQVSFSFPRPAEGGWDAALAEAAATVRAALDRDRPAAKLMPVLRDLDGFGDDVVHRAVGPEFGAFLAHVARTPRDTLGIDYLMRSQLEGSPMTPDEAFRTACENFVAGLKIEGGLVGGEKVITVRHDLDLGTSALALPDFLDNASGWVGSAEVFVGFNDPTTMYVAARADGPFAARMRRSVQTSDYYGSIALTPACFTLGPGGPRLVARRTVVA
ncbi:MAG: hypothetical protein ACRC33_21655, partial [Gemmataceae bacterium]